MQHKTQLRGMPVRTCACVCMYVCVYACMYAYEITIFLGFRSLILSERTWLLVKEVRMDPSGSSWPYSMMVTSPAK